MYIIGNKGFKLWIEKYNRKKVAFFGKYACTVKSEINIQTVPKEYSMEDALVTIIPGINFPRCQNKLPFDFDDKNAGNSINTNDLYCDFW